MLFYSKNCICTAFLYIFFFTICTVNNLCFTIEHLLHEKEFPEHCEFANETAQNKKPAIMHHFERNFILIPPIRNVYTD